jgi:hypothetical protein
VASALNEIEPELQRIRGYKDLEKLRDSMEKSYPRTAEEKKVA